jgi:hypothetical protein
MDVRLKPIFQARKVCATMEEVSNNCAASLEILPQKRFFLLWYANCMGWISIASNTCVLLGNATKINDKLTG